MLMPKQSQTLTTATTDNCWVSTKSMRSTVNVVDGEKFGSNMLDGSAYQDLGHRA